MRQTADAEIDRPEKGARKGCQALYYAIVHRSAAEPTARPIQTPLDR